MAHFDGVLPGKIHRVIYEELVADLEGVSRQQLDFVGVPFEATRRRAQIARNSHLSTRSE